MNYVIKVFSPLDDTGDTGKKFFDVSNTSLVIEVSAMNISNVSLAGLTGIQNGLDNLKRDANDIAHSVTQGSQNTTDLTKSLVDLKVDERQVEASVKVVKAADDVLGALIDIKA